jgi:glutamate racemase
VIATPATLRDGSKFTRLVEKYEQDCTVIRIPAPGLVELVEQGKADSPEIEALLQPLLEPWRGKLDGLVLGCTHYPFAAELIGEILGPGTVLLDGGAGTARQTKRCLEAAGLLFEGPGSVTFESSSEDGRITELCARLLKEW